MRGIKLAHFIAMFASPLFAVEPIQEPVSVPERVMLAHYKTDFKTMQALSDVMEGVWCRGRSLDQSGVTKRGFLEQVPLPDIRSVELTAPLANTNLNFVVEFKGANPPPPRLLPRALHPENLFSSLEITMKTRAASEFPDAHAVFELTPLYLQMMRGRTPLKTSILAGAEIAKVTLDLLSPKGRMGRMSPAELKLHFKPCLQAAIFAAQKLLRFKP